MPDANNAVLISGAGIAGPVLAYWLKHHGFEPTIVERAPELRMGGHAVDLWGSAVTVIEGMGMLSAAEAARTRNDRGFTITPGREPLELDLSRLTTQIADRQIEIMRGELVSLLHERTKDDVDYIFGDSVSGLEEREDGVRVTFEKGSPRDFALVVGADGQHSNIRRLAFGEEAQFSRYIGGYICGYTIPNVLKLEGAIHRYVVPNKTVVVFPIRQSDELGVGFLFRRTEPLRLHHDDLEGQKRALRDLFRDDGWEVPRLLEYLDNARSFYFDSFSQILMDRWVTNRIALVGDAGYCPAPAVGGGTSLAVLGAYKLACELAKAPDDLAGALRNYQASMEEPVAQSRKIGPALLKVLIPSSKTAIAWSFRLTPLLLTLPPFLQRWVPILPRRALNGMRAISDARLNGAGLATPGSEPAMFPNAEPPFGEGGPGLGGTGIDQYGVRENTAEGGGRRQGTS